jgi:hypothetical protein
VKNAKYTLFAYAREVFSGRDIGTICQQLLSQFSAQGCDSRIVGGGGCLAVMPIDKPLVREPSAETLAGLKLIEAVTETLQPLLVARTASAQIATADRDYTVTAVLPEREIEGDRWCLMNASADRDRAAGEVNVRFRKDIGDESCKHIESVNAGWRPAAVRGSERMSGSEASTVMVIH